MKQIPMNTNDFYALQKLEQLAIETSDGHFTAMRFTGNWRVALGTIEERDDISGMAEGSTLMYAVEQLVYLRDKGLM